jgi:hypothetical protein
MALNRILKKTVMMWLGMAVLVFGMTVNTPASEVILTADALNATLKQIQKIQIEYEKADAVVRAEGLHQTGVLVKDLAALLSEEVALYDSQQGGLIQLALDRTKELGFNISWVEEKKRFIYDGQAFAESLKLDPDGKNAGETAYLLLETEFVRAEIDDESGLQQAVSHKTDYMQRYPEHDRAAEVGLLLAIDYRDLWRHYKAAGDAGNEARYRDLTRQQFQHMAEKYAGARQAKIAQGLLARFESELAQPASK